MEAERPSKRRIAVMDRAWVLLMLHCGLRTIEVRQLTLEHIRFESRKIHLEGTKNLGERVVYMSDSVIAAVRAYLEVRGDPELLPPNLFLFWHRPLSKTYCLERLQSLCAESGLRKRIRPHQLRHSFASLILNAGAPVETVQLLLGHQKVQTTLGYARVYDGTAAADYYQAMSLVACRLMNIAEATSGVPSPKTGELIDKLLRSQPNPVQFDLLLKLKRQLEIENQP